MAGFKFDENEGTFYCFLLSIEALVLIPFTYCCWPSDVGEPKVEDESHCCCNRCQIVSRRLKVKVPWSSKVKEKVINFHPLIIGWMILFATAYKVSCIHNNEYFDPFDVLQVNYDATVNQIKTAYRRLSLIYHPDMEAGDEKKFIRISKAYTILTNTRARKNWIKYGNPDGPSATSIGIALPSWITKVENSVWILGLYALVMFVVIPVAVWKCMRPSVQTSSVSKNSVNEFKKDQVTTETMQLYMYFLHKTPYMLLRRVLKILACSLEFEKGYNSEIMERPSDNIEVPQLMRELPNLIEKNREQPLCFNYSLKARALLHAHLSRMTLPPDTLAKDKLCIVKKCPHLLNNFVQMAAQMTLLAVDGKFPRTPNLDVIENAMKLSALIVQALRDNESPLLQLPHVAEDLLRHFTTKKQNIRNIHNLASMKSDDRRAMLHTLNNNQYKELINVLSKMPLIEIEVTSEVLNNVDSCTITAGAIVIVTITLTRKNMSTLFGKELPRQSFRVKDPGETERNQSSTDETDESDSETGVVYDNTENTYEESAFLSALLRHDTEWKKVCKKVLKKENFLKPKSEKSHRVHCPFFPEDKQEYWWVYLADTKRHSMVTVPYLVTNRVKKEKVVLTFTAPPKAGIYSYTVFVRSDSYCDLDVTKNIKITI